MTESIPIGEEMSLSQKGIQLHTEELSEIRLFGFLEFRYRMRLYFAEFFGTLVLVMFGLGINSTVKFNPAFSDVGYFMITVGWGFGLAMALFVSMGNSGGHLNPAVTVSAAIFGRFPWRRVPGFIFAQVLGAVAGSSIVYGIFRSKYHDFDGGKRQTFGPQATAGIFATYPDPANSTWDSILSETALTALLLLCIQGIFDTRMTPAKGFEPIAVGLLVLAIGITNGIMTGYAINPARDFGPRLFTRMAGWGTAPFTAYNHYFWIPLVMPFVGATIGVGLYEFFIIPNLD